MKHTTRKELKNWLKENGFSNVKIKSSSCFSFNSNTNVLAVGRAWDVLFIDGFADIVVNELHLKYDASIPSLYFLHELGHYKTEKYFTYAQDLEYIKINKKLDKKMESNNEKVLIKTNLIYQHLPQEITATKWAVRFANNHYQALQDLDNIFKNEYDF